MTELLPAADKVEINQFDETVVVPDGKVWRVSLTAGGDSGFDINPNEENPGATTDSDGTDEFTLHENCQISGEGVISGWEFDYQSE